MSNYYKMTKTYGDLPTPAELEDGDVWDGPFKMSFPVFSAPNLGMDAKVMERALDELPDTGKSPSPITWRFVDDRIDLLRLHVTVTSLAALHLLMETLLTLVGEFDYDQDAESDPAESLVSSILESLHVEWL